MAHLIVEAYKLDYVDFLPEEKEVNEYPSLTIKLKSGKLSPKEQKTYDFVKKRRKYREWVQTGFAWTARLVDAVSGETVFEVPRLCQSRWHADRYGRRFITRYEQTGKFDVPLGTQLKVG